MAPPDSDPAIEVRDLSCTYGRGARAVRALEGLSFAVRRGESLALLGPNGSGKSTTIRVVLGLQAPRGGSVRVLGGPAGHRAARGATGYVPEESRGLPALTGREYVDFVAAAQGVPRRERRARVLAALEACGLDRGASSRAVTTYSRGMTRRVALAAALVARPALLVLDEPTSGLDPLGTEDVLGLLARHRQGGGSILLSTHDRVTVEGACDRAVVLAGGRGRADASIADLLAGDDSPSLLPLFRRTAGG